MEAVTIHDREPFGSTTILTYDLADLLRLAGHEAIVSTWSCEMVDCLGPSADELERAAAAGPVPGGRLADLAGGVTQTIDGLFEATRPGEAQPWLVLRAIDGCYFVVVSSDKRVLAAVRERFRDVQPSPEDAEWYAPSDGAPDRRPAT